MNKELREILVAIGRSPNIFYRDTPLLLETLDKHEAVNRRVMDIGRFPDRRKEK